MIIVQVPGTFTVMELTPVSVPGTVIEDPPGGMNEYDTGPPVGTWLELVALAPMMLIVITLLVVHPSVKLAGLLLILNVGKP